MRTITKDTIARMILEGLSKQQFADWYSEGGRFDDYLADSILSDEEILADIRELFKLD